MRLTSQLLQHLQEPNWCDTASKCLTMQLRFKHRSTKKLEDDPKKKSECLEPCKVPRRSVWSIFRGKKKQQPKCLEKEKKPVRECETVKMVPEEQAECDMKTISEMGGNVYRTGGTAYILQKDQVEQPEQPESPENEILEEMMKDPSLKGQCDPMPPFQSVELKLIELNERKLHPLYKKLMSIPKRPKSQINVSGNAPSYKTRSGPVLPDEFPAHLKINREMFEKKNILYEFKRTEPPQQLLARIVEMRNNERPRLMKNTTNKGSEEQDCSKK